MILAGVPAYCVGEANRLSCRVDELIRVLGELGSRDEHDGWLLLIAAIGALIALGSLIVAFAGLFVGLLSAVGSIGAAWAAVKAASTASAQSEATADAERRRANEAKGLARSERRERYEARLNEAVANAAEGIDAFVARITDAVLAAASSEDPSVAQSVLVPARTATTTRLAVLRMTAQQADVRPAQLALNAYIASTRTIKIPMSVDELVAVARVTLAVSTALTLWRRGGPAEALAMRMLEAVAKDGVDAVLPDLNVAARDEADPSD